MPNGIALQGQTYTALTKHYQLMNVQRYHPGIYAPHKCCRFELCGKSVVFTTHPAKNEDKSASAYPATGRALTLLTVQHKMCCLCFTRFQRHRLLELYSVPQFSHTYLPEAFLDEEINGRYALCAMAAALPSAGKNELHYKPFSMYSAKALKTT